MNTMLEGMEPYTQRDQPAFLSQMNELTRFHLDGCREYRKIWPAFRSAISLEGLPFLHVGIFKHLSLKTMAEGIQHQRTLKSSATSSGISSLISLDKASSELQSASTLAILKDFVGEHVRPLLVLDSSKSLLARGGVSARIAAALSLRPLASELHFLLEDEGDPSSMKWDELEAVLRNGDNFIVYGFTWILWLAWGASKLPGSVRRLLESKRIVFVHSGGWKKLEKAKVSEQEFNSSLLKQLHPDSRVVDFYGLVEQVGIIYPLCEAGFRHPPAWADILVRDPWTMESLIDSPGQLQLMNTLARGAPYHNVLTEDLGQIVPGNCPCERAGNRFKLLGRVPQAEIRGCANV